MKKLLLILLCLPMIGFGQSVPQGINYQAVARDASGDVLMNQALTIQFSVISDITTSAVSWQETHTVSTNDYGLYTAIIGQGTATSVGSSATIDVIDWGASNHFLKVEVDYGGGIFVDMGTTAFMSVPYALHSTNPGPASSVTYSIGDTAQGGIVFYVSPDGKNGLVAATVDQSTSSTWYDAFDVVSNPSNHTSEGQKFRDWRLPTKYELNEMYINLHLQGLGGFFASNGYFDGWSSTESDPYNAWNQYFSAGGYQVDFSKAYNGGHVRAVRAF